MTKPPRESAATPDDAGRRRPDYVIELAVNPDLLDRAGHITAERTQAPQATRGKAAEPDADPQLADWEASQ